MPKTIHTSQISEETLEQKRTLNGLEKQIVFGLSLVMALLQVYLIIFSLSAPMVNSGIFLMFVAVLVLLLYKPSKKIVINSIPWYDWIAAFLSSVPFLYGVIFYEEIIMRATSPTLIDKVMMIMAILAILEISRRTIGLILPAIALVFILYAVWGGNLPGIFVHRGYDLDRLTNTFFMTTNGIYGSPTKVAATMVFMFVFFGSFLNATGASRVITDGSFSIAGKYTGGPAKVAIFASALMGSVSGSASANVATTGQLTIPLMKKIGYKKDFAAGVESAASTGGTITPPIMGAGAFIMAETTGIPYSDIVKAAIIPALLFYMAVFTSTHFEAKKLGLKGLPKKDLPNFWDVLKKGYHVLLPLVLLIVLILVYVPVMHAAFYSTLGLILTAMLHPATRIKVKEILNAVSNSAYMVLQAAAACACAGIVIGILNLTGLGLRFSTITMQLAGHSLFLALFFTMVIAIILGMGLPPVAAYIIGAAVTAPALTNLGFPLLASHLFIFYFAAISSITPPVAVTAYIGAGIAGGSPLKTAVISCILGLPAFIVPYMFMFSNVFLLQSEFTDFILLMIPTTIGFICLSSGIIGFFRKRLLTIERVCFIGSGVLLLIFDFVTSSIGILLMIGTLFYHYKRKNHHPIDVSNT